MSSAKVKPKIIITTAPLGAGHMAAAKAMLQALESKYSKLVDVEICDVLSDTDLRLALPVDKIAVPAYSHSVRMLRSYPYKLFFDFANVNHKLVNQFFTSIFRDKGTAFLKAKDPDLILSTFPIISYAAGRIVSDNWHKPVPIVSIVTDAGDVHKLWLASPSGDILVSTPETIDYAVKIGTPRERLHYLGFPIDSRFTSLPTREQARKELSLGDKLTVYVTGGGMGLSNKMLELAKKLAKLELGVQYIFIGGRNTRLVHALRQIEFADVDTARVYGFVDNVPLLLAASDLVVGKAGWLTIYEAMICKRPMIILDVIPGQEEPNAEFVVRHGAGEVIRDPGLAAEAIARYKMEPGKLIDYEKAFENLKLDPYAAEKIADFVIEKLV